MDYKENNSHYLRLNDIVGVIAYGITVREKDVFQPGKVIRTEDDALSSFSVT